MRMGKKISVVLFMMFFVADLLSGCGQSSQKDEGTVYQIYTVNKEETKVESYEFCVDEQDKNVMRTLIEKLKEAPESTNERAAIMEGVELLDTSIHDKRLVLNFSESYNKYSRTGEVLSRAAIVRTLCQLEDVDFVSFLINGNELANASGANVGMMNAEQFVENNGSEINAYERTKLKLYFADKNGSGLKLYEKEVVYNSNISMEKLIVEQMIEGPGDNTEEYVATINPATKVLSVTTKDGTCYVNLDSTFLTPVESVSPEVTIYSIVNALTELTNVYEVQISIDGDTDISYLEKVSLAGSFERNYELLE